MSAVVSLRPSIESLNPYSNGQLALIRRTVAKDCNNDEFDLFIQSCRALRLDPLRKQIYAFVFHKEDAAKRQLVIVTAISGLRAIAERTQNYRPDEDEPTYTIVDELKGPTNPHGIEKCTVRVWKFVQGEWHKVTGVAYWDEFAPIKVDAEDFEWVDTGEVWPDSGKPKRRKKLLGEVRPVLDPKTLWPKMGRHQIAKCAEALALRKAWPDAFSSVAGTVYGEEEIDKQKTIDLTASEILTEEATQERLERIGHKRDDVPIDWTGQKIEFVSMGSLVDRVCEYVRGKDAKTINDWQARNEAGLRLAWGMNKSDGLEIKRLVKDALDNAPKAQTEDQREMEGTGA